MVEGDRIAGCEEGRDCPKPCSDPAACQPEPVTVLDFDSLARGAKVVCVTYRGQCYQLRATRNGKLILNK